MPVIESVKFSVRFNKKGSVLLADININAELGCIASHSPQFTSSMDLTSPSVVPRDA